MKLLVSTTETQGRRRNDFCFVPEGEILTFTFECDSDRGNPDGSCGCSRSMSGIECKKGTTTFKVAEVEITLDELRGKLRVSYPLHGVRDAQLNRDIRDLRGIASPYPVGAILEKRENFQERKAAAQ